MNALNSSVVQDDIKTAARYGSGIGLAAFGGCLVAGPVGAILGASVGVGLMIKNDIDKKAERTKARERRVGEVGA